VGAGPLQSVLRQAARLTVLGGIFGVLSGLAATRFLASLLYGVATADASSFALGWFCMSAAAVLAGYLPARRASRVDPMVALRYE